MSEFTFDSSKDPFYIVPVSFVELVINEASEKKDNHIFPNEAWIEANACLDVVNYIKENFETTKVVR